MLGDLESPLVWSEQLCVAVSCRKAMNLPGVTWWVRVRCPRKVGEKTEAESPVSALLASGGEFCSEAKD